MSVQINGTNGLTFNDGSSQNTAAIGFGFKNRIINGAMMIDQRNAGASVTPANSAYTVDRWQGYSNPASKFTVQQSTDAPAGFTNSLKITSTSAYAVGSSDLMLVRQFVEGNNCADLAFGTANASAVSLSFWVKSSLTGTFGGVVSNDGARSYPFTYTISSANTWERKTLTVSGDTTGTWATDNTVGISVVFGLGVGSTYSGTAGAWAGAAYYSATGATSVVGTNGATFYITGVQLEKGSTATSFDYRPYGTELALCQRYYEVAGTGVCGVWKNSTAIALAIAYKVQKRASPTTSAKTTSVSVLEPATAVRTTTSFNITGSDVMNSTGMEIEADGFSGATAQRVAICYTDCFAISSEL